MTVPPRRPLGELAGECARGVVCRALECHPDELLRDVRDGAGHRRRMILYRDRFNRLVSEVDALVAREVEAALSRRHGRR